MDLNYAQHVVLRAEQSIKKNQKQQDGCYVESIRSLLDAVKNRINIKSNKNRPLESDEINCVVDLEAAL